MQHNSELTAFAAIAIAILHATPAHATDWLQFGYDTAHSGFNRAEAGYPTASGNKVLYHYALPTLTGTKGPGTVDGAPIYVRDVVTPSGTRNIVFGLTNNGTFYALDADSKMLNVLWSKKPSGAGANTNGFGSGAVDPSLLYVYAYGFDGKIHKYQVGDGQEFGVDIADANWPEVSTLKPNVDKGAASLSFAMAANSTTYLYSVTDGYIGDGGDYQGHVTTIDLATGTQKVFNSLCSDLAFHFVDGGVKTGTSRTDCASAQNGIWGRPGAVYDAGTDRAFITTGNGPFKVDVANVIYNWGDSVVALHPDGSGGAATGMPVDSYTPTTFGSAMHGDGLQGNDADLGSESIAIVPPPTGTDTQHQHIAVQAGKDGCVRLINLANLSGQGAPAHTGGELQALNFSPGANCATGNDGPEIRAQPAVWVNPADGTSWVYIASRSAGFVAYQVTATGGVPSLAAQWSKTGSTFNEGGSPVVANGVLYWLVNSQLQAFDAVTGAAKVTGGDWNSTSIGGQHWQSPILVDGRFYLFDNANPSNLWVYELDGMFKSGFE